MYLILEDMNSIKWLCRMTCCGGTLMTIIFIVVGMLQNPRHIEMPEAIPIVLGLSSDSDISQTVKQFMSKWSAKKEDISLEVIQRERMYLKKIPLRHMLKVKNFVIPGLSSTEIQCFFLRNRLMEVVFIPRLSKDECKLLFGEPHGKFVTPGEMSEQRGWEYYQGDSTGEDHLDLVDYIWGSGVRSALLWRAYVKLSH